MLIVRKDPRGPGLLVKMGTGVQRLPEVYVGDLEVLSRMLERNWFVVVGDRTRPVRNLVIY